MLETSLVFHSLFFSKRSVIGSAEDLLIIVNHFLLRSKYICPPSVRKGLNIVNLNVDLLSDNEYYKYRLSHILMATGRVLFLRSEMYDPAP